MKSNSLTTRPPNYPRKKTVIYFIRHKSVFQLIHSRFAQNKHEIIFSVLKTPFVLIAKVIPQELRKQYFYSVQNNLDLHFVF